MGQLSGYNQKQTSIYIVVIFGKIASVVQGEITTDSYHLETGEIINRL